MLGDEDISKYQVKVTLNTNADKDYINFVSNLIEKLFIGIRSFKYARQLEGCTIVGISSKKAADSLKIMGIVAWKPIVPLWIFEDERYLAACIRGLIDTEGSVGFKVYKGKNQISVYKQLTFTNKNAVLFKFIRLD